MGPTPNKNGFKRLLYKMFETILKKDVPKRFGPSFYKHLPRNVADQLFENTCSETFLTNFTQLVKLSRLD